MSAHYELSPKRKLLLKRIASFFLSLAALWILYYLFWGRFHDITDDAYVSGNLVRIMPRVNGTVTQINTDDTKLVKQNDPIVQLDDADAKIQLERASANLALTVRRVRQYYDNANAAVANLSMQKSNLQRARYDYDRRAGLSRDKVISREELQHFDIALDSAQAQLIAAQAELAGSVSLVENTSLYLHPEVLNAKANFENAYLNLKHTKVLAPVTGYIAKRSVQIGQQVTAGTPLMAIVPLDDLWVDANYKESQLDRIRIGQRVTMHADTYDEVIYHGKVIGLSPGTGSAFDLLPPQNATGNWIKVVQRLPVRISLDPQELKEHPLRVGLSVKASISTFGVRGKTLAQVSHTTPVYETDIYAHELLEAESAADKIISDNAPDVTFKTTLS